MKSLSIMPVEGRKVLNPEDGGRRLVGPAKVPRTPYWLQRIALGDVTEQTEVKETKPKPKPKK